MNFANAVVYRIVCKDPAIKDCYVGSTTNFTKRKCEHKYDCTQEISNKYNIYVYQFIRDNGGWKNWEMLEICKATECTTKQELLRIERRYLEELKATLNRLIPIRTEEERKILSSEYKKEYYEENKSEINEKTKQYYETHKEEIAKQQKQYYEENKQVVLESCKKYYEKNKNHILQHVKEYTEQNKDKIKQYKREYQQRNKEALAIKQRENYLKRKAKKAEQALNNQTQ